MVSTEMDRNLLDSDKEEGNSRVRSVATDERVGFILGESHSIQGFFYYNMFTQLHMFLVFFFVKKIIWYFHFCPTEK